MNKNESIEELCKRIAFMSKGKIVKIDISTNLKKGQLVVLESTTYPGTTREVLLPELEEGRDLNVGLVYLYTKCGHVHRHLASCVGRD